MSHRDGLSGFKQRLADENPDEEIVVDERPDEAEPQPWHQFYFEAWDALRYDRQYVMGGEMPIPYSAMSRYAHDHDITGQDFETFRQMLSGIDVEWLDHVVKRKEAEK